MAHVCITHPYRQVSLFTRLLSRADFAHSRSRLWIPGLGLSVSDPDPVPLTKVPSVLDHRSVKVKFPQCDQVSKTTNANGIVSFKKNVNNKKESCTWSYIKTLHEPHKKSASPWLLNSEFLPCLSIKGNQKSLESSKGTSWWLVY